ncbi:MAG: glycosyltransferase [Hyphomicrobiaceae bacterium]|nr:glycosyltransferase [Hyphomicrobiaceae bacterium]
MARTPMSAPGGSSLAGDQATAPILFVTLSLDVGGAERHLASLLPALARRGWPVSIYCTNRLGAFADDVRRAGVEVIGPPIERTAGAQRKMHRLRATALAGSRLVGVIRRLRPAIVHFFLPEAYVVGAPIALALGVPVRIMSRRGLNLYQRSWPGVRSIERKLHRRMSGVLANSRRVVADLAEEGCAPERIGLIYNGVALAGLDLPIDRRAVRDSLGIGPEAFVIVVVANLIHYKGHADLLAGLAGVTDRLPACWRLVCVGRDEGARASLVAMIGELGLSANVVLLGVRSDVAALLAAGDLAVLPSQEEGFSNAIIEAMAAGLPQVVTDVGGNAEAVIHGQHGLVVPPRDPIALGMAVARLAGDAELRARMGAAARERARARFALSACVDRYETVYRGLLAGSRIGDLDLD